MSIRANVDRAGLDQRITLERKTITRGGKGEQIESWTLLGEVWARVDAMKAGERVLDASIRSSDAYTVWIRAEVQAALAITQNDRIVWKGRPFDIQDVMDQQLKGRLVAIYVVGGLNQG